MGQVTLHFPLTYIVFFFTIMYAYFYFHHHVFVVVLYYSYTDSFPPVLSSCLLSLHLCFRLMLPVSCVDSSMVTPHGHEKALPHGCGCGLPACLSHHRHPSGLCKVECFSI